MASKQVIRAMPSARAFALTGQACLRVLTAGAASIAIAGCSASNPVSEQNHEQAAHPFATVQDNHGCFWRLELKDDLPVYSHIQVRADGMADCPPPVAPQPAQVQP